MKKELKSPIDEEGKPITKESYLKTRERNMAENVGKAYGFFYCDAPKQKIERELSAIRECAKTPSELELLLIEGMDNVTGDEILTTLAQEAKHYSINYVLQATYPNETNRNTAEELVRILDQAYLSPLYKQSDSFNGEIVYKEKGKYIFVE